MFLKRQQNWNGASIPEEIQLIIESLKKKGFESYVVGGCVRDLLIKIKPQDWDIATEAKPEQISQIFPKSYIENKFGTVTVLTGSDDQSLKEVEITPYRIDEKYTDKRHPDRIHWAKTIEEDLARRDFTVNALALDGIEGTAKIIDPFAGQKDLENKIIRAVGNAEDRFSEDALRMMRAVRFAATLNFEIEEKTSQAVKKNSAWLRAISKERIRDELLKIIMSDRAAEGIELLRSLDLLKHVIPELEEGYNVTQNKHHIYGVYQHSLLSLKYAAKKEFNEQVRLAVLFHDIAKPRVKKGEGPNATFYNHEVVGAKITCQILERLKFSKKDIEKISKLVRYHLFYYNVDEVGENSVRRLVRQVGPESMEELLQIRMSDRIGSGCPKAEPYKLRHLKYIIDKVSQDPISVRTLKISGNEVMDILKIKPGPKVGQFLDILFGYVLENPKKNQKEILEKEIKKLEKLSEKELEKLTDKARKEREEIETKRDEMTKKKYWVT
jgi:poly(A) polymerase/tRNA nucleotidyltransferase (CCA-adding enzyme)